MAMHFDFTDLQLIIDIACTNSITGGAELSHMSVPAASTRIKNLEDKIGIRLLYRGNTGASLTPAGQTFVGHARLILRQTQYLRGDMHEYISGIKGHVRIFANTTSLGHLPRVLRHFLSGHPDVNIDLQERPSPDIVRAVTEGQTDIGIVAGTVHTENLETLPYRRDRLVLVVPSGHTMENRQAVPFAETLAFSQIGLHESTAIHTFLRQASDRLHTPIKQRIQVSNFEAACRMVESGIGVGILPESAARHHAETMKIHLIALTDAWSVREMLICMRSMNTLPRFTRDLIQLLRADAQGTLQLD